MARLHAIIRGRVQGVFFRSSLADRATSLQLVGWVRNRLDGSVECVAEGDEAALLALHHFCEKGPSGALVERVEFFDEPESRSCRGFTIRPDG